ncbi:MAG: Fe-S cluster assembly protein SufD [Alphaproteobacteria bacterium]
MTEAERAFARGAPHTPHAPAWLAEARDAALRSFAAEGLPDRKVEAFHFTDLHALLREPFPPLAGAALRGASSVAHRALALRLGAHVVPVINGIVGVDLAAGRALPQGVELVPLRAAMASAPEIVRLAFEGAVDGRANAVRALNTGLARDGAVIRVRAGVKAPLIVLDHSAALEARGSVHLRHLIVLEEGASADVLEIFSSDGAASLTTCDTIVQLAKGAQLSHAKLIKGNADTIHLGRSDARLGAEASYRLFVQGSAASVAREEISVRLEGEGGHFGLGGALLLSGEKHFDLTASIDHASPRCTSDMEARAVLAGRSKGVVQGAVRVAPHAQHTVANQQIRGLLLSDRAEFDSKPELEILADDVKCAHGAASGDLDSDAIFYLRSRGIPEDEVRALLVEAFLEQGLAKVENEALRDFLREETRAWLKTLPEVRDA